MKDILEIRKHLHQHPEIGFDTFNTANYIYDILVELGYETEYALDKRAVIAYLDLNKKRIPYNRENVHNGSYIVVNSLDNWLYP